MIAFMTCFITMDSLASLFGEQTIPILTLLTLIYLTCEAGLRLQEFLADLTSNHTSQQSEEKTSLGPRSVPTLGPD